QNPQHTYLSAGTYTVNLTATNAGGSDTEIKTDYITVVAAPTTYIITLNANKPAYIGEGDYIQFTVTGLWSYITIDGSQTYLDVGDTIRLIMGTDGTGQIYATGSMITTFSFDDIDVYKNGVPLSSGSITGIYISDYGNVDSTLSLTVPPENVWTQFIVDGNILINGFNGSRIELYNMKPGSAAVMNLDNNIGVYYYGGAENYEILPPPPVADFTASPTSGTAPLTVQFTDTSTNSPTSWAWDVDNNGVVDYTTQNPQHTYSSSGKYTVNLTATNAGGSDTEIKTDYITVTASIFYDDFEAAFSGWTTSDRVAWYTGTPKIGTHSIELKRRGSMEQTISTSGYTDINVSFYMGAYSLDRVNEYVEAHWYDGSIWTLMKRINNGDPEEDKQLHYFQYDLPTAADNNAAFALRFRIVGSGPGDYGYVDNVRVMGVST
ncbi:MAG: PKD domain-containing protein, partial [Methanogenium sp.]|nr:PKD domain-containing protein [Methanogenium sp.]